MNDRPYFHLALKEIEVIAATSWNSVSDLERLVGELKHRSTHAAGKLLKRVLDRLTELGASSQSSAEVPSADVSRDLPAARNASIDEIGRQVENAFRSSPQLRAIEGGPLMVRVILHRAGSPNDPYVSSEGNVPNVSLLINLSHPHWQESLRIGHLHAAMWHGVADAIAEVLSRRMTGPMQSHTTLRIKDQILRATIGPS